jgi:hypothetical protein
MQHADDLRQAYFIFAEINFCWHSSAPNKGGYFSDIENFSNIAQKKVPFIRQRRPTFLQKRPNLQPFKALKL